MFAENVSANKNWTLFYIFYNYYAALTFQIKKKDNIIYCSELIKNKTLVFLSKALPYLKDDPKMPKVTKIGANKPVPPPLSPHHSYDFKRKAYIHRRTRREKNLDNETTTVPPEATNMILDLFDNETSARQNCDQGGAAGL